MSSETTQALYKAQAIHHHQITNRTHQRQPQQQTIVQQVDAKNVTIQKDVNIATEVIPSTQATSHLTALLVLLYVAFVTGRAFVKNALQIKQAAVCCAANVRETVIV